MSSRVECLGFGAQAHSLTLMNPSEMPVKVGRKLAQEQPSRDTACLLRNRGLFLSAFLSDTHNWRCREEVASSLLGLPFSR